MLAHFPVACSLTELERLSHTLVQPEIKYLGRLAHSQKGKDFA